MEQVFPVSAFRVRRAGCTEIKSASVHWPCVFPQHGPGKKHERRIRLQPWQRAVVDERPEAFLRGLFHSDGCRVVNRVRRRVGDRWKYYEYPRYFLGNSSEDILGLAQATLDRLGARWSFRWVRPAKPHLKRHGHLSVAEKGSVALLDSFIGPKY